MNTLCPTPLRVLLVEDDAMLAAFLIRALGRAGHHVESRTRGDEGLRAALGGAFDVLVLDWRLPVLDGLEVVRALRLAGSELRVRMLSGNGDFRRQEALDAGADEFLNKPCGLEEFTAAVAALAGHAHEAHAVSCAA